MNEDMRGSEGMLPTTYKARLIRDRGELTRRNADMMRQAFRFRSGRDAIKHLQGQRATGGMRHCQSHLRSNAQRKAPGQRTRAGDAPATRQGEGIHQQEQQQQTTADLPEEDELLPNRRRHRQHEPGEEQFEQQGGRTHENQTRGASMVLSRELSMSSTLWPLIAISGASCTR